MRIQNLIYLLYYTKITDWNRLREHRSFVMTQSEKKKHELDMDMLSCTMKYGFSFHEYYYYGLWGKDVQARSEYASMGFMFEFEKKFNPLVKREILADKNKFYKAYEQFMHRRLMNPLIATVEEIDKFIEGKRKIVLKKSTGSQGKNVRILDLNILDGTAIKTMAEEFHFDILEEFVSQHDELQMLSPNSLNTIRIITFLNEDGIVDVIGSILRMGIEKNTDNMSTGGIA